MIKQIDAQPVLQPLVERKKPITDEEQALFDAAVASFCEGLDCTVGPPRAMTEAGNPYVEILSNRPINAEERTVIHLTLEGAIAEWRRHMLSYLNGRKHIVWRIKPEIASVQFDVYITTIDYGDSSLLSIEPVRHYAIYSRLTAY